MDPSIRQLDVHAVEHTISEGFPWLRFDADLERRFEADTGEARCRTMIRLNYVGLAIYHAFLISDYRAIGDVFEIDLIAHFLVMTPIGILANSILGRRPSAWLREAVVTTSLVLLAATIFVVVSASRLPNRDVVLFSAVLVVLFAVVMQRLRFWYVVTACMGISAFYIAGLLLMDPFSPDRALMSVSVFLGIVLFSLVGAYNLERDQRTAYLLRLRDHFRHQDLELVSRCDALTGIGNRRALDLALTRLSGSEATASSTAAVLIDIDHFKILNDTNGHVAGDACLKRIAELIAGSVRQPKTEVYRFGGEEFLVLIEDATSEQAVIVAERIRSAVESARIPRDASATTFVTLSAGVACGRLSRDWPPKTLIANADGALYAAKRAGRNRVVSAAKLDAHATRNPAHVQERGDEPLRNLAA